MAVTKENSVIVILDALGTKGKWTKTAEVKNYVEAWEDLTERWRKELGDDPNEKSDFHTKLNAFSDTIIMKNTGKDIDLVLTSAAHNASLIILEGISKKIFLRGCISVGQIFSSDKMIIGKAIDEAAEYYMMPNWVGLTMSPSAYNAIQRLRRENKLEKDRYDKNLFIDYDIPLKIGIEKGIAVNYLSRLDVGWGKKFYEEAFGFTTKEEVKEIFQKELESLTDLNASLKIRNTIEFIQHVSSL